MRDLTEAGRAVVENPPLAPTPVEQIATRARRRRQRRVQSSAAIAAVVVLLAGAAVVAVNRHDSTTAAVQPSATSTPRTPQIASPGHRIVSYHGVHVEVPASWPVVDGMHAEQCGGPFPKAPTVFVGENDSGPLNCPFIRPRNPAPDGVWLQPGRPYEGATRVTTPAGAIVSKVAPTPQYPVEQLWFHQTSIQIGIGADPTISRKILESIGFTAGAPDTAAAGACARQDDANVMPAPERLTHQMVLEGGIETLNPPLPSDRAVVPAAIAWKPQISKPSYARYRLILARYSALYPENQNADGTVTPANQNVLAWVVYSTPISATIPGCGTSGIDVTNAITGAGIVIASYGNGP